MNCVSYSSYFGTIAGVAAVAIAWLKLVGTRVAISSRFQIECANTSALLTKGSGIGLIHSLNLPNSWIDDIVNTPWKSLTIGSFEFGSLNFSNGLRCGSSLMYSFVINGPIVMNGDSCSIGETISTLASLSIPIWKPSP